MAVPEIVQRECLTRTELGVRYGCGQDAVKILLDNALVPRIRVNKNTYFVPLRALEAFEDELGREAAKALLNEKTEEFIHDLHI